MISCGLAALAVTLAIEVPLVTALFPGQRLRMALLALVMNTITNVTLNYVLARIPWLAGHHLLVGEVFALVAEAAAYAAWSRPRRVARSVVVSVVGNALSLSAGLTQVPYLLCR